jgi:hypothetical protein
MALDRTWYNTLVNDDGTNTVGSVWDKTDVDALMNAVDAEIVRLDGNTNQAGVHTPTIVSAGGGTPLYLGSSGVYARAGKLVYIGGQVALSSKGSLAAGAVGISIPFVSVSWCQTSGIVVGYFAGLTMNVASLATFINPGAVSINMTYVPAAGGSAQILDCTHLTNTFNLVFGGVFRIN